MTQLEKRILESLDTDFRYEQTDWTPAYVLMPKLLHKQLVSMDEVARTLEALQRQGMVDYKPTKLHSTLAGFLARLTSRGYNSLHFGRPSLIS